MKIEVSMKMPKMPNYFRAENAEFQLDVGELSDVELKEFCIKWQDEFLKHAKARKDALNNPTR